MSASSPDSSRCRKYHQAERSRTRQRLVAVPPSLLPTADFCNGIRGVRLFALYQNITYGSIFCRMTTLSARTAEHPRSEEHTSVLQSLMRISYAVFCLKKKKNQK